IAKEKLCKSFRSECGKISHLAFSGEKMNRIRKFIFAIVLALPFFLAAENLKAQTVPAAATAPASYAPARAAADKQAHEWLSRGTPGLALAVAIDGNIVSSEGFGFADLEERIPVWPTTKFRIGSISKPLTATALMQLVEAGKIDLDAPVQK